MAIISMLLIACIAFGLIRYLLVVRKFYRCSKDFPGKSGLALLENISDFRDKDAVYEKMGRLRDTFRSPMSFWLGPKFYLFFGKPAQLEIIFNSKACQDKSNFYKLMKDIIGSGLFNSSGENWTTQRKLLNPTMSHKVLLTYLSTLNSESQKLVWKLEAMLGKGDFCIQETIEKCIFDITGCTILGTNLNTQDDNNLDLLDTLQSGKNLLGLRLVTLPYHFDFIFRLSKWYPIQKKTIEDSEKFFKNLIQQKLAEMEILKNENNVPTEMDEINKNLKKSFINETLNIATTHKSFDLKNVKENLYAFYIASIDTTVRSISNAIFCLAAHPEYQQRVIEEINELFPNKDCEITFEDTKKMVYTDMVINETLRLFPSIPFIARHVSEDFYLDQKLIPKDTEIVIDIFYLHRDKDIWGPNCNKFDPDRFLPRNVAEMHPYQFIPFSKGPRNCIGWRYAYMIMKVVLAKIFQNYRFTTDFKVEETKFQMDVTIKAINQPLVRIHRLEN